MKERLSAALRAHPRAGRRAGRFEPIGSMWVEADCNIPSGESLVRQIVHGKRFFLDEFDRETTDLWLPDVFGYSAALPQILQEAGITSFLTQKMSWSETNRFPHSTFWWEGIDGTRILTHFPPADTYNGNMTCGELAKGERQFAQQEVSKHSLYPFGYGDGGGGPTRAMLEAARRVARSRRRAACRARHGRVVLGQGARRGRRLSGVGRRAVPRVPPGHVHDQRPDQARQPAQRAGVARGRAVVGRGGRARPRT